MKTSRSLCWILALGLLAPVGMAATPEAGQAGARPKIGLALGGGGALGIAHVGVIRALEELRIPIDFVAGTSMGAIVGGMYASGMSPDEMERSLVGMNWWDVMKDKTAREDMQYRRKRDDARYLMDIELGLKGSGLVMPHGLASGQKFNNVMQSMTVNAAGITDFSQLNIPYHATGTDIKTGTLVMLTNGNLATAMRASMAVPGAFTPVTIDGRKLVDGGIVDNLPVDVARAMGADIVIAVDVGKLAAEKGADKKYESVGEILGRTYDIMRRPDQDRMGKTADILIAPDTSAFSASDFQNAAAIIPVGVDAVAAVSNQLAKYSVNEKTYQAFLDRQRRNNERPLVLRGIKVTDTRRVSDGVILAQVRTPLNEKTDLKSIEKDAARIYGLGDFQNVTYELEPVSDGYNLALHAPEKYWGPGYMRFGLRLESDGDHNANWGVLVNYSRRQLNALGGEVQLDLEGGTDQNATLEWYQPLNYASTLFVAPVLKYQSDLQPLYSNDTRIAEYERNEPGAGLDVGSQFYEWGEFRAGVYFGDLEYQRKTGAADLLEGDRTVAAWTTRFALDRLDDAVFPTKGFLLNVNGFFADENLGSDDGYQKMWGTARFVKSFGRHTLLADGSLGHSLGSDVPVYDQFTLGGFNSLPGVSPGEIRGPYFLSGGVNYRFRLGNLSPSLGDGVYTLLRAGAGNAWPEPSDMDLGDMVVSFAAGLGADTALGPLMLGVGRAEDESTSYFLSIGTLF